MKKNVLLCVTIVFIVVANLIVLNKSKNYSDVIVNLILENVNTANAEWGTGSKFKCYFTGVYNLGSRTLACLPCCYADDYKPYIFSDTYECGPVLQGCHMEGG